MTEVVGERTGSPYRRAIHRIAVVLAWIAVVVVAGGWTGSSTRSKPSVTTADVPIGSLEALRSQAGVSLAEDPQNPRHLVVAINDYNALQGMSAAVSDDRGRSWHAVNLPRITQQRIGDPRLAYGPHGILYLAGTGYDWDSSKPPEPMHLAINLFQSRDGGRHWTWLGLPSGAPQKPPVGDDYPALTVDPVSGTITIGWTRLLGNYEQIMVARSADGGHTFGRPLTLSSRLAEGVAATVDSEGNAIVAYMNRQHGSVDVSAIRQDIQWAVQAAPLRAVPSPLLGLRFRVASDPAIARDQSGHRFYLTLPVLDGTHTRVSFSISSDNGRHWSIPALISADRNGDSFMPTVAVSPVGVVGLFWYERLGSNYRVYLATSTDCGHRFSAALALDSVPSSLAGNGPAYLGDYAGLVLDRTVAHAAWTDSRDSITRIYTRGVPIPTAVRCL